MLFELREKDTKDKNFEDGTERFYSHVFIFTSTLRNEVMNPAVVPSSGPTRHGNIEPFGAGKQRTRENDPIS